MYGSFIYRYFFVNASPLDPPPEMRSLSMCQAKLAQVTRVWRLSIVFSAQQAHHKPNLTHNNSSQSKPIRLILEPNRYMYDSYVVATS